MRGIQVVSVMGFVTALARASAAQLSAPYSHDPDAAGRERVAASAQGAVVKARIFNGPLPRQPHVTHPDYASLTAGVVLFGFSYAVALAEPVRHGLGGESGPRAIPLAGPWFAKITWPWALDGVMQLGGAAFIANALLQPVTVLGTPAAQLQPVTPEFSVSWTIDL